jgi:predicted component of type VI protein secretion system
MFEPFSPMFVAAMRKAIIDMIDNFEPRVVVIDVLINYLPDNNAIEVTIEFRIINTERPLTLGIVLERTR